MHQDISERTLSENELSLPSSILRHPLIDEETTTRFLNEGWIILVEHV